MNKLTCIRVEGYKSIREMSLELGAVNVLIGANGAGKSNLVSFFKMLNYMMAGSLGEFVARSGHADSLLHFGGKRTVQIEAELTMNTDAGENSYRMRVAHTALDGLTFLEESIAFARTGLSETAKRHVFPVVGPESCFAAEVPKHPTHKTIRNLMQGYRYFQFHDTSEQSRIRQACNIGGAKHLLNDAGNLGAILYNLQEYWPAYYRRIVASLRSVFPFFQDFVLEPSGREDKQLFLSWRGSDPEQVFGPHQLSDGTLRMMALVTLLLQPEQHLPALLVIDEPELGLHPYAIEVLASLIKGASHHCQIILATQSVEVVNMFDADEIVIVELNDGESRFKRLDEDALAEWLEEYSKRIIDEIPEYAGVKPAAGSVIACEIGLPKMREKCPHFDEWVTMLEGLNRKD